MDDTDQGKARWQILLWVKREMFQNEPANETFTHIDILILFGNINFRCFTG